MADFVDFALTFSLNLMIVSGGIWSLLRVIEKVFDIFVKKKELEIMEEAE